MLWAVLWIRSLLQTWRYLSMVNYAQTRPIQLAFGFFWRQAVLGVIYFVVQYFVVVYVPTSMFLPLRVDGLISTPNNRLVLLNDYRYGAVRSSGHSRPSDNISTFSTVSDMSILTLIKMRALSLTVCRLLPTGRQHFVPGANAALRYVFHNDSYSCMGLGMHAPTHTHALTRGKNPG